MDKDNLHGLNFASKYSKPSKSKRLSNTTPLQGKHPKKIAKSNIYIDIEIDKGEALLEIFYEEKGNVSKLVRVLNRISKSGAMLTWYQGNFIGVLNRLIGSEAMAGKKRGEEHTLYTCYKSISEDPG